MKRVWQILILAAVIVAGTLLWSRRMTPPAPPAEALPALAGAWSRVGSQVCTKPAAANFPLWPGTDGARQVCRAQYSGSPSMTLTVYDMPERSAFGPFQEWETGKKKPSLALFRYRDNLYVEESPNADMGTLTGFAAAVLATRINSH